MLQSIIQRVPKMTGSSDRHALVSGDSSSASEFIRPAVTLAFLVLLFAGMIGVIASAASSQLHNVADGTVSPVKQLAPTESQAVDYRQTVNQQVVNTQSQDGAQQPQTYRYESRTVNGQTQSRIEVNGQEIVNQPSDSIVTQPAPSVPNPDSTQITVEQSQVGSGNGFSSSHSSSFSHSVNATFSGGNHY